MSQIPTEPRPDQQNQQYQQYQQLGQPNQPAPVVPMYVQSQPKDPDTAFILELIGGFIGFLGVGYLYTGQTNDGLIRLVGWWVLLGVGWVVAVLLSSMLIGCLCMPPLLAIQVGVPIWSALNLKNSMIAQAPPPPLR